MQANEEDLALFNDSLERCQGHHALDFLGRFYDLFMATSEEVREKFKDTDLVRQKRMLAMSLYDMIGAICGNDQATAALEKVALIHSRRDRDIRPEFYDAWFDALLQAVRECDPDYTPRIERAWRAVMAYGIEFLKSRYSETGR